MIDTTTIKLIFAYTVILLACLLACWRIARVHGKRADRRADSQDSNRTCARFQYIFNYISEEI